MSCFASAGRDSGRFRDCREVGSAFGGSRLCGEGGYGMSRSASTGRDSGRFRDGSRLCGKAATG